MSRRGPALADGIFFLLCASAAAVVVVQNTQWRGYLDLYNSIAQHRNVVLPAALSISSILLALFALRPRRGRDYAINPIRSGAVILTVLAVVAITAVAIVLLLGIAGTDRGRQLEAIKTALATGAGVGGAGALILTARRQQSTEREMIQRIRESETDRELQERIAGATERDAAERRVNALYSSAAEQLGSDKVPIRLAGLYSLERLAKDHPSQSQTVTNLICAYLRSPIPGMPRLESYESRTIETMRSVVEQNEDLTVREAAQLMLTKHLRERRASSALGRSGDFWGVLDIDLTGAVLTNFTFDGCRVNSAIFRRAMFLGPASFDDCQFAELAQFEGSCFSEKASFRRTSYNGNAIYRSARIFGSCTFSNSKFYGVTDFSYADIWDLQGGSTVYIARNDRNHLPREWQS